MKKQIENIAWITGTLIFFGALCVLCEYFKGQYYKWLIGVV